MVFSQTSLNTQTVLKVVKLDHLKTENKQQVIGSNGVASSSDGYSNGTPDSPVPTTSTFTEVSLKSEPLYDSAMFNETDYEFFQELAPLCYVPEKEEVVQTIDSFKKTEEKADNIDTPHIPFSPQAWEQFDVNSPQPQLGCYNNNNPLSPNEKLGHYDNLLSFAEVERDNSIQTQERFLNINSLTSAFGDSTSEIVSDMNSWQAVEQVEWANTPDTHFNIIYTNNTSVPFINGDDSVDLTYGTVVPGEVEFIDLVPPNRHTSKEPDPVSSHRPLQTKRNEGLSVDVTVRAPAWSQEISTPVILNEVISLEKENCTDILDPPKSWQLDNTSTEAFTSFKTSPKLDYEPITPKSESHMESDEDNKSYVSKRRRRDSEDSDKTYTPYTEQPPRKYKRRKPSVPIKDLILALESQPKARRGRPPKRRESTVSSVCSVDENSSSASTQEYRYRELRDKNNEASKRSRMNRRVKEKQMEELAVELEEANKRLKVRVGVLEEMTKKLKNELMSAILKK